MRIPSTRLREGLLRLLVAAFGILPFAASPQVLSASESELTFERDIRPILRTHCLDCHGATDSHEGNLDLRLVRFQQKGGDSGPAIVSGQPAESLLVERIKSGEMPPGEAKVTPEELQKIEAWIAAGAPTARPEPESIGSGVPLLQEEREWWSFRPLTTPAIPEVKDSSRVRTPIDSFLLAAMPEGLSFSADASRLALMLRASFDLTGLPPTPERMQEFLNDQRVDAYERLVDELLASPHYGERWGRHWLDIAGYSDSEGRTEQDVIRDSAYRYRDYVVRALNSGMPFDQFLEQQLAGDELAGPIQGDLTPEQIELLTATGFLRMAADGTGSGDNSPEGRNLVIADTIQIVSSSLLGLTVACAQCHDHRYDPISHVDYFALRAIFDPALDWQQWATPNSRNVSLYTQADRELAAQIEAEAQQVEVERNALEARYIEEAIAKELLTFEEPLRQQLDSAIHTPADKRTPEQQELINLNPRINITPGSLYQYLPDAHEELKKMNGKAAEIRARKPREEFVRALVEPPGHLPKTHLFYRGDHQQPKQVVAPAAPAVLAPEGELVSFQEDDPALATSGRRLAFARWLTSPSNPITSRVLVNRIWLHHFGRGLVQTPADFGKLGAQPTHPELLDWLATELISSGWNLKKLQRTILLSTAYRQSSARDPRKMELDDTNRSHWRKDVIRLDAEVLRDRVLFTTGHLNATLFGPPIPVKEDAEGQTIVDESTSNRRSLYIQQRRSQPVSILQAFDAPVMAVNCEVRPSSTVATQSLMMMNSQFTLDQSLALANRILDEHRPHGSAQDIQGLPSIQNPPQQWQYGYGGIDESGQTKFTLFPHYNAQKWQGLGDYPAPETGWAALSTDGGHTGNNPDFAVIRRWNAPVAGQLRVTSGHLNHLSEHGDGVRGRIVSNRHGLLGEWTSQNQRVETSTAPVSVEAGDTIDFITDCRENTNADSFHWEVNVELVSNSGPTITSNSRAVFSGDRQDSATITPSDIARAWELTYYRQPSREELELAINFINQQLEVMALHPRQLPANVSMSRQAFTNLCQALLTSNEFLYVE
ncbi:DUF1553 domain-containing protein [Planctomicrobium sp. SH661]|uniref:PSD1 and planctomycete cytochrome C domain-containing protein n=1 Tax=Planctomicrobium sp. SH661 TaxID=3448124 RepID=UPI003F5BAD26